jgi:hypothetical protein
VNVENGCTVTNCIQNGKWFAILPIIMPSQFGYYINYETKYFKNNTHH